MKDSTHFIPRLKNTSIKANDILVSFDVESLFSKVPLDDIMQYVPETHQLIIEIEENKQ